MQKQGVREFLNSPTGKAASVVVALVALGLMAWSIKSSATADGGAAKLSTDRIFICSETGKTFYYTIKIGDSVPVLSPHSGKKTGYEPERCFWTKDGKIKAEPTYVLLNSKVGKPDQTFCPDCGRLVTPLNPQAVEGMQPPPTKDELAQRNSKT